MVAAKLDANVITSKQELVNMTVCPHEGTFARRECLERQCERCGSKLVSQHYNQIRQMTEKIQWSTWEYVVTEKSGKPKRLISCVTKETTLPIFFEAYEKVIGDLSSHLFRAEWQ